MNIVDAVCKVCNKPFSWPGGSEMICKECRMSKSEAEILLGKINKLTNGKGYLQYENNKWYVVATKEGFPPVRVNNIMDAESLFKA